MTEAAPGPYLVSGAAGFVGASLVRRLASDGGEVHALVRPTSDLWRLQDLTGVEIHRADLLDDDRLQSIVRDAAPGVIFHCATHGGYHWQQDFQQIVATNVVGTANLLHAAESTGYRCFINTGSSSEYGAKSKPMSEDDPLEPVTVYGASKAAATLLSETLARAQERPVMTLRLFSPYGPYEDPARLIPSVIEDCLAGRAPRVSSGDQARDFVFIDDVVEVYLRAAQNPQPGATLNVGSGTQHLVKEVVSRIVELSGADVVPQWGALPGRAFETKTWVADISRLEALYGYRPPTTLDDGLARTIEWHRQRRAATHDAAAGVPR